LPDRTAYGADKWGTKYSPLDQIDADNFNQLEVAWRWSSADDRILEANPDFLTAVYEATPLKIGDVLYVSTSMSQVAAIDAVSGETIWVYDAQTYRDGMPVNVGFVHRGVSYWADGEDRRIIYGTGDAYLIALDADSGKPVSSFGENGRADLTKGLRRPIDRALYGVSSPPVICGDVVVICATVLDAFAIGMPPNKVMPPGDVRGFDARTGEQLWVFQTVPQEGEFGNETWEGGSWKNTGSANVWTVMSADEELGYVYLPVSTPTNDYYGGNRLGDNLFAESLVCLNAATGGRVWHFQIMHHGLWDYDLPAHPNLVDIEVDGRKIKAVA
jgi:quinoprotein glucose dehydrogenase